MHYFGILIIVFSITKTRSSSSNSSAFEDAAKLISRTVNLTADPCDDFYLFTCGKFIASEEIGQSIRNFSKLEQEILALLESPYRGSSKAKNMARDMYKSCNDDSDEAYKKMVKHLMDYLLGIARKSGVKGRLFDLKEEVSIDLTKLFAYTNDNHGARSFFEFRIGIDSWNTERNIITIYQGNFIHGDYRKYFVKANIDGLKESIVGTLSNVWHGLGYKICECEMKRIANGMIQLEIDIAKVIRMNRENVNMEKYHNVYKVSALKTIFPTIDWKRYFKLIVPDSVQSYIDSDPEIIVFKVNEIRQMSELIARKRLCWNQVFEKMDHALSSLYVSAHFNTSNKAVVAEMAKNISQALAFNIEENDWMDDQTKKEAVSKARQIVANIGYEDWILDEKKLDKFYENLNFNSSTHIALITEQLKQFRRDKDFGILIEKARRTGMQISSVVYNALYYYTQNSISIPAGYIQPPFYSPNYPQSMNYGVLGVTVGHEMSHAFGAINMQFDGSGLARDWWTNNKTNYEYDRRLEQLEQLYGNETVVEVNMKLDGRQTLKENLADNEGIKAAFRAYKNYLVENGAEPSVPGFERFTNEQLFFIANGISYCSSISKEGLIELLTDEHTPERYRVNVMMKNFPAFAEAFHCPNDSRMNPSDRVVLW